jgi:hypothetical protein
VDNFLEDAHDLELLQQFVSDFARDGGANPTTTADLDILGEIAATVATSTANSGSTALESSRLESGRASDVIVPLPRHQVPDEVGDAHAVPGSTVDDSVDTSQSGGVGVDMRTRTVDCVAVAARDGIPSGGGHRGGESASVPLTPPPSADAGDNDVEIEEIIVAKVEPFVLDDEADADEFVHAPRFDFVATMHQ